jgi:hypothetical protein
MKKRNVLGLTSIIVGTSALSLSSCSSYGPTLQDYTNNPTAAGFDPIKLDIINGNINEQIERVITDSNGDPSQGFPSLQICVTKNSKVVYNKAFGKSLRFSQGDTGDTT